MRYILLTFLVLPAFHLSFSDLHAQGPVRERIPVLLDTDIGTDIDDAFALALILASPELELRGVTAVGSTPMVRALMLCRFLTMTGRRHTPVAAGGLPQPERPIKGMHQYYYHPDVLFNRTTRPMKESAVDFLYGRLKAQPGKVTLLAAGPLTNLARLIKEKPDCKPWIKQIVVSDRSVPADGDAARAVFSSGIPLLVIPSERTANLKLGSADVRRVFAPGTALTQQVQALYQLWDGTEPILADPLAVAVVLDKSFCQFEEACLEVDNEGRIRSGKGKPNAELATSVRGEEFLKWYVDRLASCVAPAKKPAQIIAQGGFPHRVHVAEDFENDIERRWWMSGKAESKNLPGGSKRACRGVLTHDFDDLLGNPKAMYTAVIFNPVPGPPMGKHPRLTFKYWLKGTDTLRVQIYSLTNGYHRHLVLTGLPQGKWQSSTVDMRAARRPDGTGGPLSENERIDDIQFYTDPTAELIIDDIVLFDASGEKKPFPKRIHFTGWFDSGKQGKEWPGTFEIAANQGFFWHAARSVKQPDTDASWIRLHLRGPRLLGEKTHLFFRYRLSGANAMQIALVKSKINVSHAVSMKGLTTEKWAEAVVDFTTASRPPRSGDSVDEIHFLLPAGAELLIDDLLLYEPGS
ncbi:MAG TPA: nucleoside hydrolase [Gemmataceae bacterium]|nr:nucleoside hydrolase [Gemmataceae bacterium]